MNGVIFPPIHEVSEVVKLTFEKGWVVDIRGGTEAEEYARYMESFDDTSMYCLDHFTFGVNPKAVLTQPELPAFSSEAEKVMRGITIGLGRVGLTGAQHTDVVAVGSTAAVGERVILKDGKYTVWDHA